MLPIILIAGLLVGVGTPAYQEFARHSNGNPSYQISYIDDCPTGIRPSGYALAPGKFVLFKQRSLDGTAGDVCVAEKGR